jgi:uncharacterized protein YndB with AHSA1/START domain
MPVSTTRITDDQDAIVSEIEIAAPPERVFKALIDRREAMQWGSGGNFEMTVWEMDVRPGGKWQFISHEKGVKNPDGSAREFKHHGEVLEVDPPRTLAYTWFANWHENPSHKTVVRWELTAIPSGTRLKVTHSGLLQLPAARAGYSQGWPGLVEALKKHLEK